MMQRSAFAALEHNNVLARVFGQGILHVVFVSAALTAIKPRPPPAGNKPVEIHYDNCSTRLFVQLTVNEFPLASVTVEP